MLKQKRSERRLSPKANGVMRFLIALVTCVVLFALLALSVTPSQYDIKVGDYAPSIIKATKEVVDEITTNENREREVAKVTPIKKNVGNLSEIRDQAVLNTKEALNRIEDVYKRLNSASDESGDNVYTLENVNAELEPYSIVLDQKQLNALKSASLEEINALEDKVLSIVGSLMDTEIFEDEIDNIKNITYGIMTEEDEYSEALISIFIQPVYNNISYNVYYDEAETEAARQAAREKATVVKYVTGQVIVEDGKQINEAQYAMMKTLGLINESDIDIWLYIGIALIIVLIMISIILYLRLFDYETYKSPKKLLIISIACLITLLICVLTKHIDVSVGETKVYITPVTLSVLIIALMINFKTALFINVPLGIVVSMLSGTSGSFFNISTYTVVISTYVSGCVALRVLKYRQSRLGVLLSGLAAGISCVLSSFAVSMISSASIRDSLYISLYSGIGGPGSAIICIAVMPAFEAIFNSITTTRLIELSNPNHPLLRRLLLEAPGTYHHSIIVANLAEAAANEIGANSLLARVGAYYHDIGKLVRPTYFTENQMGDNPHDRTDPRVSTAIITAHPRDGMQLLKEKRMPEEIKNIALSHHGDTPVIYFYNKALKENEDAKVDDFRYPGPKPHTKEEAIVMLADSVEAATRAINNPDKERVRETVDKLITQKINDGQLDDCDISFRDISRIEKAFITVLSGAFHDRIEYPNVDIPKKHNETENDKEKDKK